MMSTEEIDAEYSILRLVKLSCGSSVSLYMNCREEIFHCGIVQREKVDEPSDDDMSRSSRK